MFVNITSYESRRHSCVTASAHMHFNVAHLTHTAASAPRCASPWLRICVAWQATQETSSVCLCVYNC